MEPKIRVVGVGLGAIGSAALARCLEDRALEVVGAVDPAREGEKIADVEVAATLSDEDAVADVALVATGSSVPRVAEQIAKALGRGLDVVSTCEELAYPQRAHAAVASRLDAQARERGKTVVAAGVNPGFVMDVLPVALVSACLNARSVMVTRQADLARRRKQLRAKVGVGLAIDTWRATAEEQCYGHRGLIESAYLCAVGLGWDRLGDAEFSREPIPGDDGLVKGIREVARLEAEEGGTVVLELVFEVGGRDQDRIEIDDSPPLRVTLEGGVHGDDATVARMLHSARLVGHMAPGLRLPTEVPGWLSA